MLLTLGLQGGSEGCAGVPLAGRPPPLLPLHSINLGVRYDEPDLIIIHYILYYIVC
jgi:hypothetical protein